MAVYHERPERFGFSFEQRLYGSHLRKRQQPIDPVKDTAEWSLQPSRFFGVKTERYFLVIRQPVRSKRFS